MSEWSRTAQPFGILPEPFPEPFSEEDISVTLGAILKTIDVPFRKSESVPKTILIDFFGPPASSKTTTTRGETMKTTYLILIRLFCGTSNRASPTPTPAPIQLAKPPTKAIVTPKRTRSRAWIALTVKP